MTGGDAAASSTMLRHELGINGRVHLRYRDRPSSLGEMLSAAALNRPDGEAIVTADRRWTWQDLASKVARLASGLERLRISRGDRIAILVGNDPAFLIIAFATAQLGATFVPISEREQRTGLAHVLQDSGAVLLFYLDDLAGVLPPSIELPHLTRRIAIGSVAYEDLFCDPADLRSVSEDEIAAIVYTSGTSGPAKGVPLTHGAIVHSAISFVDAMDLSPDDRSIVAVPLSHVTGLIALVATVLRAGSTMILLPHFSARSFLELAEQERMTHTVMVPAMYNLLLLTQGFEKRDLAPWRMAGFGGAPMPRNTIEKLRAAAPALKLMNIYGATETASPAVMMPPAELEDRLDAIGRPAPGCEIVIMNEVGIEVGPGETGELWIRGAMVAERYWSGRAPEDFRDGYWRSGDLGSIGQDGIVTLHGRGKEVINRGGYKIYPAEIEGAIMAITGVIEVAVVARTCAVLGERVHAAVVVDRPIEVNAALLRATLEPHFADYKLPESWDIRDQPLPRNPNGKLLKREIQALLGPYVHHSER